MMEDASSGVEMLEIGAAVDGDVGSNGDTTGLEALGIMLQTLCIVVDIGHEDGLAFRGPDKGKTVSAVGPGVIAGTLVGNQSVDASNNAGASVVCADEL